MSSNQAFVLVLSRFSILTLSFAKSVEDVNIVCATFLVSEEYSITHYKLKECLDLWQNEEATSDTTTLDFFGLLDPPF